MSAMKMKAITFVLTNKETDVAAKHLSTYFVNLKLKC